MTQAPAPTPSTKKTAVSKAVKVTTVAGAGDASDAVRASVTRKTAPKAAKVSATLADDKSSDAPLRLSSTKKSAAKTTKSSIALTDEQAYETLTHAPSSKKVTGPNSQMAQTSLGDRGNIGSPVVPTVAPESAPSKGPDNPPSRKTLTAAKPKAAAPKTVKSVAQDADTVEPKTPKRRPSSSHPDARDPKIAKTVTPLNQSTRAIIEKSPMHEISRANTAETPKDRGSPKQQSITRWTQHSPASRGNVSLGGARAEARPSIVPEVASPLARKASLVERAPVQHRAVQNSALAEVKDYPNFRDGDVLIISPLDNKTWTLHSTILCNASPVLKNIITKQEPFHIKRREHEEGMTVKWKLIMSEEPDARYSDPEGLIFKSFKAVVSQSAYCPV